MKNISVISSNERYDEALKIFYNAIDFFVLMGYEVERITSYRREKCVILSKELKPIKIECFVWSESKRAKYYEACFVDKTLDIAIKNNITNRIIEKHEGVYF